MLPVTSAIGFTLLGAYGVLLYKAKRRYKKIRKPD
jgi:hypothetical protein